MAEEGRFPGMLVPSELAKPVLERFLAMFRVHTEGRPANIPTWCTLSKGILADEAILANPSFLGYESLYFFFENGRRLHQASPQQIRNFFLNREPWENKDYYIFNPDISWCIAITHEVSVIFVGNF
jgi:hypothetical protein